MPKKQTWKYKKERTAMNFDEYLILPEDKTFKITIKNWIFTDQNVDGQNRTVFRTDVIKLNGKETNKRLVIKNYNNVQEIKKKVSKKTSARSTANLKITRKYDQDEMDYYFNIEFLK
jgi:hypothetical protein